MQAQPDRKNLQTNRFCGDVCAESRVMFDEQNRRAKARYQLFQKHARNEIDIIERFVPNIEVRGNGKRCGQSDLLFLSVAECGKILAERIAAEVEFVEDGHDEGRGSAVFFGIFRNRPGNRADVLRKIGNDQIIGDGGDPCPNRQFSGKYF